MALALVADVSEEPDIRTSAQEVRAMHEAKALSELKDADAIAPGSDTVAWRGSLLPAVAVVKGLPGPAEAAGGAAVSGLDGAAVVKGLEALGYEASQVFFTLSRPMSGAEPELLRGRLRAQLEAVDAPVVLALDGEAADDLAGAFGLSSLGFGVVEQSAGRHLFAVDGLEVSLTDQDRKKRVWEQFLATKAKLNEPVF